MAASSILQEKQLATSCRGRSLEECEKDGGKTKNRSHYEGDLRCLNESQKYSPITASAGYLCFPIMKKKKKGSRAGMHENTSRHVYECRDWQWGHHGRNPVNVECIL